MQKEINISCSLFSSEMLQNIHTYIQTHTKYLQIIILIFVKPSRQTDNIYGRLLLNTYLTFFLLFVHFNKDFVILFLYNKNRALYGEIRTREKISDI